MSNIECFDVEYNHLSRAMKMTLVLDEAAIKEVRAASRRDLSTSEALGAYVVELLERSIALNAPRSTTPTPYGGSW